MKNTETIRDWLELNQVPLEEALPPGEPTDSVSAEGTWLIRESGTGIALVSLTGPATIWIHSPWRPLFEDIDRDIGGRLGPFEEGSIDRQIWEFLLFVRGLRCPPIPGNRVDRVVKSGTKGLRRLFPGLPEWTADVLDRTIYI